MMFRRALACLATITVGAAVSLPAEAGTLVPPSQVLSAARDASSLIDVKKKVKTRKTAPEDSKTPSGKANNGEVLFGVQDVGFLVDRDVIRVGPEIGKFDRIRVRVLKNEIFITDLQAVFEDGATETLISDEKIRRNRKTSWIPLEHKGFIKEFRLIYRSKPNFKGQARVEIFGEYAPGWLGPDGEGRRYNNGWVLLGTDTAGSIGFDRVTIPVGANEGGFKKVKVAVKDRDITLTKLSVVYEDGKTDALEQRRTRVPAGEAFGPVALDEDAAIKEIKAVWRSRAIATSKRKRAYATVQVWAHH